LFPLIKANSFTNALEVVMVDIAPVPPPPPPVTETKLPNDDVPPVTPLLALPLLPALPAPPAPTVTAIEAPGVKPVIKHATEPEPPGNGAP
jgi:hypothetical protein